MISVRRTTFCTDTVGKKWKLEISKLLVERMQTLPVPVPRFLN